VNKGPRIFFATDVHGSEVCWRKFVNSGKHYEADVLILGGDMTGKAIVPIVEEGSGRWVYHLQDVRHDVAGDDDLARQKRSIRDHGYYPVVMSHEDVQRYTAEPKLLDALFVEEMRTVVREWVTFADERLEGSGIQCIVCPGNDDDQDIDEILASSRTIQVGEGNVIDLPGGYQLVSSGWTNPTPWDTHREEAEDKLKERLMACVELATVRPERLVLGLHAPPHDTQLDVAPKIIWESLEIQGQDTAHVGSTAVREVIEAVQPLLSLHGHIHEGRGAMRMGRTLVVNPGSSYVEGTLDGCVIELDGKDKVKKYRLTSG
jgi:Icc-related predicted phosphoesterase